MSMGPFHRYLANRFVTGRDKSQARTPKPFLYYQGGVLPSGPWLYPQGPVISQPVRQGPLMDGFSDQFLDEEELVAGSLITVRSWEICPSVEGQLYGRYGGAWQPGENVAVCHAPLLRPEDGCRDVPNPECGCGFWSYYASRVNPVSGNPWGVLGVTECYGRVLMGTEGIRSEKARILALCPQNPNTRVSRYVATPSVFVGWYDDTLDNPRFEASFKEEVVDLHAILSRFDPDIPVYHSPLEMLNEFRRRFDEPPEED